MAGANVRWSSVSVPRAVRTAAPVLCSAAPGRAWAGAAVFAAHLPGFLRRGCIPLVIVFSHVDLA